MHKSLILKSIRFFRPLQGSKVAKVGATTTLDAPRDVINLHIRGGFILPAQKPALNTMLRFHTSDINLSFCFYLK
jgi:hypothetical protein